MKLNSKIKAPDGRIGTICYNNLDGVGGVWDAVKAAITRTPRLAVPQDVTFSCYIKGEANIAIDQVEYKQ